MSKMRRFTVAAGFLGAAMFFGASRANAQYVIGNWSNDTNDGWFDWTTGNSGNAGAGGGNFTSIYSYVDAATGMNNPGSDDLLLTNSGFRQSLSVKLEYEPGDMAAFEANNALQVVMTVPASTSGYNQIYEVALNMTTWGFNALTTNNVPGSYFSPTGASYGFPDNGQQTTYTMTIPYSQALAVNPTPGYAEFILTTNNGSGASNQIYFDSASLVTIPEPATAGLAFGVVLPLLARRRNRA